MIIVSPSIDSFKNQFCDYFSALTKESYRSVIETVVNTFIQTEFQSFLNYLLAAEDTKDNRNGSYERTIYTDIGPINIKVPRDRLGLFKTTLFRKHQQTSDSLVREIQNLYANGMTQTNIVNHLATKDESLSRETIRKYVNKTIGKAVEFNSREIPDCPIVFIDGTYVSLKTNYGAFSSVNKCCVMVVMGITKKGKRVILGYYFTNYEGATAWKEVLEDLKKRGLKSPKLFVSDGLEGMPNAILDIFPKALHQTCLIHISRNLMKEVKRKERKEIANDFKYVYTADNLTEAQERLLAMVEKWSKTHPKLMDNLLKKENLFTFMSLPKPLRKCVYTSNAIESVNSLIKRETKKHILYNSEDNAILNLTNVCEGYNEKSVYVRAISELTEEERITWGFEIDF